MAKGAPDAEAPGPIKPGHRTPDTIQHVRREPRAGPPVAPPRACDRGPIQGLLRTRAHLFCDGLFARVGRHV
eukprot:11173431-Lingulodinium_polyedra.AAC.1